MLISKGFIFWTRVLRDIKELNAGAYYKQNISVSDKLNITGALHTKSLEWYLPSQLVFQV